MVLLLRIIIRDIVVTSFLVYLAYLTINVIVVRDDRLSFHCLRKELLRFFERILCANLGAVFTSGALWKGIRRQRGNPRCGRPSPGQNRNLDSVPGLYTLPGSILRLFATPSKTFVRATGCQMANISTYISTPSGCCESCAL